VELLVPADTSPRAEVVRPDTGRQW
jgi:hypothetical protein